MPNAPRDWRKGHAQIATGKASTGIAERFENTDDRSTGREVSLPGRFTGAGVGTGGEESRREISWTSTVRFERVSSGDGPDVSRIEIDATSASKSGVGVDENAREEGFVRGGFGTRVGGIVCLLFVVVDVFFFFFFEERGRRQKR
tara:strand:+ start:184 stop:618 length:435 start_codon:yes stop_codon:yes gene_type:complete